jgi:glutamate racemase
LIEAGKLDEPETRALLRRVVTPMLAAGIDTLVLGCTHYPFVRPLLQEIAGESVVILDPAPAVARQTGNVLQQHQLAALAHQAGALHCFTSGDAEQLATLTAVLLGSRCHTTAVQWVGKGLRVRRAP